MLVQVARSFTSNSDDNTPVSSMRLTKPPSPCQPLTDSIDYDIALAGNLKSALFGGEGLFLATLKGPGTVWLQSLPFSSMVDRIVSVGNLKRAD